MELILKAYDLKLKHTFTISRKSIDVQPCMIVTLNDGEFSGFGEASSNPYYNITVPMMIADLEKIRPIIETSGTETPEGFWAKIYPYLKDTHRYSNKDSCYHATLPLNLFTLNLSYIID